MAFFRVSSGGTMHTVTVATGVTSLSDRTFNIANLLPNDYMHLNLNNFFLTNVSESYTRNATKVETYNKMPTSYDPSTGILTCKNSQNWEGTANFYITYDVVCVYIP